MTQNTVTPATDNQRKYIHDLAIQRWTWPIIKDSAIRKTIQAVKNNEPVALRDASQAIDALLKLPIQPLKATDSLWKGVNDILQKLPLSRYALPRKDGSGWDFFEVSESKVPHAKFRYIKQLIGSPGDWTRKKLPVHLALAAAKHILEAPKHAAVQYAKQHGRCAVCNAHLSDPVSIAASMGPVCAKRFK
jgi:hypothetical protein